MAEEGIMALNESPEGMDRGTISSMQFSDVYPITKEALSSTRPDVSQVYDQLMQQIVQQLGDLTDQEIAALIQLLDYVQQNKDNYPEVVRELVSQGIVEEGDMPPEYDPELISVIRAALEEVKMSRNVLAQPVQSFAGGGIVAVAEAMRKKGRFGDTILAHINPEEARMLKRMGGSGTINPQTGLPEFFLGKIFKAIGRVFKGIVKGVKSILSSPIGKILGTVALATFLGPGAFGISGAGLSTAASYGLAGAITGGVTGGLKGALMGGLSGYFGAPGGQFDKLVSGALGGQVASGALSKAAASTITRGITGTAAGLLSGQKLSDAVMGGLVSAGGQYFGGAKFGGVDPEDLFPGATAAGATPMGATAGAAGQVTAPGMVRGPDGVLRNAEYFPQGRSAIPDVPEQMVVGADGVSRNPAYFDDVVAGTGARPTGTTGGGISDLFSKPVETISDFYAQNISPSRPGLAADAGLLTKYGPLAATGVGAMYLAGGFDQPKNVPGSVLPEYTSGQLIAQDPSRYYVQNLPNVLYDERGAIIGARSEPLQVNLQQPTLVPFNEVPGFGGPAAMPAPVYTPPSMSPTNAPGGVVQQYNTTNPYNQYGFYNAMPRFAEGGVAAAPADNSFMDQVSNFADGGISSLGTFRQGGFPRRTGQISGPGTEKSDDIPAMLSDGEFVMTARAVRGMGQGSRREGAKRMYKLMAMLEKNAAKGA